MDETDISDILASVSAPPLDPRAVDLQCLTRAWINERTAPDLLPYPADLITRSNEGIKRQIQVIEDMTGSMDPSKNFTLIILQTELERMKFLIRSFLRARIAKVPYIHLPRVRLRLGTKSFCLFFCFFLLAKTAD